MLADFFGWMQRDACYGRCVIHISAVVYISMREIDGQQQPDVVCLGETVEELIEVRRSWVSFDALQCRCFDPSDKERILAVIGMAYGGVADFNCSVMDIAAAVMPRSDRHDRWRCLPISTVAEHADADVPEDVVPCASAIINDSHVEIVSAQLDAAPGVASGWRCGFDSCTCKRCCNNTMVSQ